MPGGPGAHIPGLAAFGAAAASDLLAEAALARNADNLSSGSVNKDRIPSTLNNTAFGTNGWGTVTANYLTTNGNGQTLTIGPGPSGANPAISLDGMGDIRILSGTSSGNKISIKDKNSVEQFRTSENSVAVGFLSGLTAGPLGIYGGQGVAGRVAIYDTLSVGESGTHSDPGVGRGFFSKGLQFGAVSGNTGPGSTVYGIYAGDGQFNFNCPSGADFLWRINGNTVFRTSTSSVGIPTLQCGNIVLSDGNGSILIGNLSTVSSDSAYLRLCCQGHTYPGAYQSYASLLTRAASTAVSLGPVATGDTATTELQDDAAGSGFCFGKIDAAGTLTLRSDSDAKYVASSSPGATEIGHYVSAGVAIYKPGSSLSAIKIAGFIKVGKA